MRPSVVVGGARVFFGDCRDVLKTLPDNSVDSVVTDPPYELGFMGKSWDNSGIAYDVTVWVECLRVLKPGGHILAFGGSRTYHRLGVAIEDAGFEIRDTIAWLSNKTFPKSLDVSKAIDKGQGVNRDRQLQFTAWMRSTGITPEQIAEATGTAMASHYLTEKSQPAIATADLFDKLRPYLPEVPEYIDRLVAERTGIEWTAYKQREVIGQDSRKAQSSWFGTQTNPEKGFGIGKWDLTAPSTVEAEKWEGWGTGLKPCFEPVVMGRKPLAGTVAENVLAWGVGGINIEGSRVSDERRWPANACIDEKTADDLADNSRFFFVGKTTKADRSEGVEGENFHPTVKPTQLMRYLIKLVTPVGGVVLDPFTGSGSTGKAALLDGYEFIGAELTEEYLPIIESRLRWATEKVKNHDTLF